MLVRTGEPEDWSTLRALRLAALEDSPHAFGASLAAERDLPETRWRERAVRQGIAFEGGDAVGLVGWYPEPNDATAWHLVAMWVSPPARGRGVGEALVDHVLGEAAIGRVATVRLDVHAVNPAARSLYERCGFEPDGRVGESNGPIIGLARAAPKAQPTVRAGALVYDGARVALIARERAAVRYWVVPGGGIEDGETVDEAVEREIAEELGLAIPGSVDVATVHHLEDRGTTVQLQHYRGVDVESKPLVMSGPELRSGRGTYTPTWVPVEDAAACMLPRVLGHVVLHRHHAGAWPAPVTVSGRTPKDIVARLVAAGVLPDAPRPVSRPSRRAPGAGAPPSPGR